MRQVALLFALLAVYMAAMGALSDLRMSQQLMCLRFNSSNTHVPNSPPRHHVSRKERPSFQVFKTVRELRTR
jgi:hypothetical protein